MFDPNLFNDQQEAERWLWMYGETGKDKLKLIRDIEEKALELEEMLKIYYQWLDSLDPDQHEFPQIDDNRRLDRAIDKFYRELYPIPEPPAPDEDIPF